MTLLAIYFITALIVSYIHAHISTAKGKKYDLKNDWILCLLWPLVIVAVIYTAVIGEDE